MITLQSSFEYVSDRAPPIDSSYITVKYPEFSLVEVDNLFYLNVTGSGFDDFNQELLVKEYWKILSTELIFGQDYRNVIAQYFKFLLRGSDPIKLSDISITFDVNYKGVEESKKSQVLEALYFIAILEPKKSADVSMSSVSSMINVSSNLDSVVDNNIYIVNKEVYLEFVRHLFSGRNTEDSSILLYIINVLVDLTGKSPSLLKLSALILRRKVIKVLLSFFDMTEVQMDVIYQYVTKNFDKLFDFPIKMPEIEVLKLKGKIQIKVTNNTEVTFDDYRFYRLNAEYSTWKNERLIPHVSKYDWDLDGFSDGVVNFSFSDPEIIAGIKGLVTVKVTAFDDSLVYVKDFKASDPGLQELDIRVVWKLPSILGEVTRKKKQDGKLRGKIVSLSDVCALEGVVIIQAKTTVEDDWATVTAGKSDKAGNFTLPYPVEKYVSAQAIVSLDRKAHTPINVYDGLISSDFLYIVVDKELEKGQKKADCGCVPTKTADRLPSGDELIQSDQFTQDVGGTCLNLTVPNRTLKEYDYRALVRHSDPDVANYTLTKSDDPNGNKMFMLQSNGKVKRDLIDISNPVQWVDGSDIGSEDLSIYQAVTIATGHILHYKSELRSDGYSLGDLLNSVPLAPGQKKQIVVFDSSHTLEGTEDQNVVQGESLANQLLNERLVMDQIAGNIGESLRGQSSASTAGISAGLGASGSSGFLGASLGVAGGYSNSNSSASQNGSRDLSQYFNEILKQNINQNATSYRKLTASAVTTVREGQRYNAETEVIANHNHCHSVTMMYFEVLRHLAVFQDLVNVEECVYVPFLMTRFTQENVSKWADVLVTSLLAIHSNTYLKPFPLRPGHPLLPAFDAIERIKTKYVWVDYPEGSYDKDRIRSIDGEFNIQTNLPRPRTKYDFILSLPIITKTVSHDETNLGDVVRASVIRGFTFGLFGDASHSVTEDIQTRAKIFDKFMKLDDNYETVPPSQCVRVITFSGFPTGEIANLIFSSFNPEDYIYMGPQDRQMWESYASLLGHKSIKEMLTLYFQDRLIAEWDTIYQSEIAPKVFRAMVKSIQINVFNATDTTVLSNYNGGERYMKVTFHGSTSLAREAFEKPPYNGKLIINSNSNSAKKLNDIVMFNLTTMRITYSTQHFHGLLYSGTVNGDILDGQEVDIPESTEEKRDPRKEDSFLANKLIEHLNYNLEYYNKILWYNLNPDRRWLLLDGFQIEIFDKYGTREGFRSLSSVIKNDLIAVAGNSLVFPVAPGYKVNKSLIVRKGSEQAESLLDYYKPEIPYPPYRLSVPTRGVYMEAIMGSCDSCEKVKPNSSQDWTKFTTDEPTSIATVTPPVPTVTDWKAQYKDFAPPMISIQNAPNAPDPGTGLAAATDLLGKSGIFKDITGLDANQANAIKTYLSNNENVKAMAQMSSALAMQSHNTDNSAKIMDTLNTAKQDRTLNDSEYNKLVKQHIQQQIDGGASLNAELSRQKAAENPSLESAAVDAVNKGKSVKAVTTDSQGNTQSVDIAGEGTIENVSSIADVAAWIDLVKFVPPTSIIDALKTRDITVQNIFDASGDLNVDMYGVTIEKMPTINNTVMTQESLIKYYRLNINKFSDSSSILESGSTSEFTPLDTAIDTPKWESDNPLGAVIKIDLFGPDNAAVVVSDYTKFYWRFSTIKTPSSKVGNHPVSGTREFGIRSKDGKYMVYTRGADRATGFPESFTGEMPFYLADKLWRRMQEELKKFVDENNGKAVIEQPYSKRYSWGMVKTLYNLDNRTIEI